MNWAIEGLSDLAKQGFMRGRKASRAKKPALPVVACDECRDWHRQGKHSKTKAERVGMKKQAKPAPQGAIDGDKAYRGYLIRTHPFSGQVWIEKDGFRISGAPSVDEARKIIDGLA